MASVDLTASVMLRPASPGGPPGTAYLLIVENDSSRIVHLPRAGAIVIGRTSEADVQVNHPAVSRRHATIRIDDDGTMRIADLGSHNGTWVNGVLVQDSRTLASGDVITMRGGDVTLVVHVATPPALSRATLGQAGWRRRLAEEVERAITFRRSLAVMAFLGVDAAAIARLAEGLRLIDVIGEGNDGQVLVLMPEVEREQARQLVAQALRTVQPLAPDACAGLVMCPTDGADVDTLLLALRKALHRSAPGTVCEASEAATYLELGARRVLVLDPAMTRTYDLLRRLAKSNLPVLINGETGVGKENAAFAVHHWSGRTGPFVVKNCAAVAPETLVESELFGYEKGAFTGAAAAKPGLFEAAAGGTVFLDEVNSLPASIQPKLLRVLENRVITRLGDTRERPIDVRIVAAGNAPLEDEVSAGRFRKDLMFRLMGAQVVLPPLRDRQCEIPMLAREFLAEFAREADRPAMALTRDAMQVLLTYTWPGNVRELRDAMKYVVVTAPDDHVEPSDLPERLGGAAQSPSAPLPAAAGEAPASFRPIAEELEELERTRMMQALVASGGAKEKAAQLIGMPARTFRHKAKQYGL